MPSQQHYLSLEDLRLARDPDYLLSLFRKLAYRVEAELIPLDPAELEYPDRADTRRCFLLANHARDFIADGDWERRWGGPEHWR